MSYFDTVSWEPMREMFRQTAERSENRERVSLALFEYAYPQDALVQRRLINDGFNLSIENLERRHVEVDAPSLWRRLVEHFRQERPGARVKLKK